MAATESADCPETFQTFGVYALALLVVGILGGTLAEQLQQADHSLREKEQGLTRLQVFHENIVHSISSGVFTADAMGCITSFNPAAQEATGYTITQVAGRPWREVFNWHPSQQSDEQPMAPYLRRRDSKSNVNVLTVTA
jgi:PAS domain S-box